MKATGIVRRIDEQGRLVLPKELRQSYGIGHNDPVEIYTDSGAIILRPYRQQCDCCGKVEEIAHVQHRGLQVCQRCLDELRRM